MTFPLYDNLSSNIPETDLTAKEKEGVIKQIKKFDADIHNRIYALIRCHQLQNSRDISFIPYDGKVIRSTNSVTNNVSFDLEKLPISLKHIIHRFCNIESKSKK